MAGVRLKTALLVLVSAAILSFSPALTHGFDGKELGLGPNDVEMAGDSTLEGMRGRYLGFYFSITFRGLWDPISPMANLTYNLGGPGGLSTQGQITAGDGGGDGTTTNADADNGDGSGNEVTASAIIGGSSFGGANGILQISQAVGTENFLYSGIAINLAIFNINNGSVANIREALGLLLP